MEKQKRIFLWGEKGGGGGGARVLKDVLIDGKLEGQEEIKMRPEKRN